MFDTINMLESLCPTDFDAGAVFSGNPSGNMVKGYAAPTLYTPAVDPNYIYHEHCRDLVLWYVNPTDQICL